MTTIDILKRIKTKIGNLSTQNHYVEMLSDAAAEITELLRDNKDLIEKAAKIV